VELAKFGCSLLLLARGREALDRCAEEIRAAGGQAQPVIADLDDPAALEALMAPLLTEGPIHILVNNSSGPPGGPLLEAPGAALLKAFQRHVLASHQLARLLVPGMSEEGYGRIINVISTSVREPIPNLGVSNTIRGAVAAWSKTLSRELPPGLTINNVLPGFTATPRLASLAEANAARRGVTPDEVRSAWIETVPEGRLAAPQEVGAAIAFLCSPAASYIRGVSLPVDGGRLRGI